LQYLGIKDPEYAQGIFSTKHPNIRDMKNFFAHIGYIGKKEEKFPYL
jgi:hypothetical protein